MTKRSVMSAHDSTSCEKTNKMSFLSRKSPILSFVRWRKGNILPRGRREFDPPSKKQLFLDPVGDEPPEAEIRQRNILKVRYNENFSALVQFLHEEHLRTSDVGAEAQAQHERERQEHERLVKENEEENELIRIEREKRVQQLLEEKKVKAKEKVEAFRIEKEEQRLKAKALVEQEIKALESCVKIEDVREAVERALDNPVDYEFAIDLKGNIFRGRYTQSNKVHADDVEQMRLSEWFKKELETKERIAKNFTKN